MKHQFYLVENPKDEDISEQYILHAKPPRFIAHIHSFEDDMNIATALHEGPGISFFYITPDGIREVYTLVVEQQIDPAETAKIDSKLKRMADWWIDYLMWQDRQDLGKGGKSSMLADYNAQTPGLKILYNGQKWCVIYRGIIKTFDIEPLMDEFLTTKLNFTDEQLHEGTINNL